MIKGRRPPHHHRHQQRQPSVVAVKEEEEEEEGGGGTGGEEGAAVTMEQSISTPAPLKETSPHYRRMQAPIAQTASPSVFLVAHTS